ATSIARARPKAIIVTPTSTNIPRSFIDRAMSPPSAQGARLRDHRGFDHAMFTRGSALADCTTAVASSTIECTAPSSRHAARPLIAANVHRNGAALDPVGRHSAVPLTGQIGREGQLGPHDAPNPLSLKHELSTSCVAHSDLVWRYSDC